MNYFQQIDTLIIGEPFTPTFFITLPPATVSFYLEGPLKDFKGIAGQFYSDNISDSLYIRDDMLFIHKISAFEKNEYNKKYWKIPSFTCASCIQSELHLSVRSLLYPDS